MVLAVGMPGIAELIVLGIVVLIVVGGPLAYFGLGLGVGAAATRRDD